MDPSDEIAKLAQLHKDGALSDEEFARAKDRVIDAASAAARREPPVCARAIVSLVFGFIFILSPIGLALGISSYRRIQREPDRFSGRGIAIAGITLCGIASAVWAVLLALLAAGLVSFGF